MLRISLQDVCLTFQYRRRGHTSLKDHFLRKVLRRPGPPVPVIEALKNLSFQVNDGERLGIIGHNGAGKSSLLRLLAGVYRPTSGQCHIEGRISSLFELSLGFEHDATGWENIRYRGYLQQETPDSLKQKIQSIAEFTELGPALDMPIRYYSSGMLVRLAFSIATAVDPEILLIDEVLAAGDMAFIEKARARMRELMNRARAMVVVSHDLPTLATMCDRVLWLNQGQIKELGPARETIRAYQKFMHELAQQRMKAAGVTAPAAPAAPPAPAAPAAAPAA